MFSRLIELGSPTEFGEKYRALEADKWWAEQLEELGLMWGPDRGRYLRYTFSPYRNPASPARSSKAGPGAVVAAGRGRGQWRTYDTTDGLPGLEIRRIIQDSREQLWFAIFDGGVSRYDGRTFTTYAESVAGRKRMSRRANVLLVLADDYRRMLA